MNPSKDVEAFLATLDPDRLAQVSLLRALILGVQPGLTEHIKWNAPSYQWDGEDRITFNLQNKERQVRLVLHMGATTPENKKGKPVLDDETGLLVWQSDIRALLSFTGVEDITAKQEPVKTLLTRWLALAVAPVEVPSPRARSSPPNSLLSHP
jgi:hypothetical protein